MEIPNEDRFMDIIRDNYELTPSNLNKYDDIISLKEIYKKE